MSVHEWDPNNPGHTREVQRELRPMVIRVMEDGVTVDMIGSWEGHVAQDIEAWRYKNRARCVGVLTYSVNNGEPLP